jgi:hypothetical protein
MGVWYGATVIEVKNGAYKVHWDRYDASDDSWVYPADMRPSNQAAPKIPTINTKNPGVMGTLYFAAGSSFNEYYYIYPTGQVYFDCPFGGLENFDLSKACAANPGFCGNYTRSGSNISFTFNTGRTREGRFGSEGGLYFDRKMFLPVKKVGPTLAGSYNTSISSNGATLIEYITFNENRSFTTRVMTNVANGGLSKNGEVDHKGSYKINGYTLTLTYDTGQQTTHTVYYLQSGTHDYLGWDNKLMSRSK